MRNVWIILFCCFFSCNQKKLFKDYVLYHKYKDLYIPKDKLRIKFFNDSVGKFINLSDTTIFLQDFSFKYLEDYLLVTSVNQNQRGVISLKINDTIIHNRKKLYFMYKGQKNYLLTFKKK